MSKWTVWVGGGEINSHYFANVIDAERVAEFWREEGYDEVVIEEIK